MWKRLANIYRLGVKELYSLRYDPVMVFLIFYSFTFAVYEVAASSAAGVVNAAVAIVDEDNSQLSRRIRDSLLPPHFQSPVLIGLEEIDAAMDTGRYAFVMDIPLDFQADLMAGRQPVIQLNVDATVMGMAGTGASYINRILNEEVGAFFGQDQRGGPVKILTRARFNPNLESAWFDSVMEIVNHITLLAIMLTGAALIREREHGTIEHLLVMPLTSAEILLAKVWANGLVIVLAAVFSLYAVVQGALAVPIAGSIPLFVAGAAIYLFSVTSLGILLATLARSMPQFGLLALLVFIVMIMLSGGSTPLDSMPQWLQIVMLFSPSTHFISLAQAVLFRDAGLDVVWPDFVAVTITGIVFFFAALTRLRKTIMVTRM